MQKIVFSCEIRELSCIIGNLFVELEPPCDKSIDDFLVIAGTTFSGNAGVLIIGDNEYTFFGEPNDIKTIRSNKCLKGCNNGRK